MKNVGKNRECLRKNNIKISLPTSKTAALFNTSDNKKNVSDNKNARDKLRDE